MELTWCQSFIAVYEMGGFTAAAQALHRSQSRVSAHVAALEQHVGEPLLHRDVHPPTLTGAGEAFLPHARGVVDEWGSAVSAVRLRRGEVSGSVAIGSVPSVSAELLAPVLSAMRAKHPQLVFEVHEGPNTWLDDALAHRAVDIAVRPMIELRPSPGAIGRKALLTDPFVVVMREDDPLTAHEAITLDQLAGTALITTGEAGLDATVGAEFHGVLNGVRIDRDRSMAVTQPTTVFSFVEARLGLGLIGALPARMMGGRPLTTRPLDAPGAERQIGVHWATSRRLSPAATAFVDELFAHTEARPSDAGDASGGAERGFLDDRAQGVAEDRDTF